MACKISINPAKMLGFVLQSTSFRLATMMATETSSMHAASAETNGTDDQLRDDPDSEVHTCMYNNYYETTKTQLNT